jgi:hypothetical protein
LPENFYIGGGAAATTMTTAGMVILVLTFICILFFPRKYVVIPVLLSALLVPMGQIVVVGGFHLTPVRMVVLFGWLRIVWIKLSTKQAIFAGRFNAIDTAFCGYAISHAIAFNLLWRQTAALNNQFGFLWSVIGMYFLLRFLIQDEEDCLRAIRVVAVIACVNAAGMIYEQLRIQNLFGMWIGGVDAAPLIRDGKTRSQGAFGHAILAGSFAATALPLFLLLLRVGKSRLLGFFGIVSAVIMVYTSASSTPALAIVAGLLGICFWPLRGKMRMVRWGIVILIGVLQIFMKAPFWFLIAHMEVVGGSSGYHRALLVDQFIRHFFDWWLLGTKDNSDWGIEMWDTSNTYVSVGQSGGLVAFVFFIAVVSRTFAWLGNARKSMEGDRKQEWLFWFLGAAVFANTVAFFGITYWDQTEVLWYALLAIISAVTAPVWLQSRVEEPELAVAASPRLRSKFQSVLNTSRKLSLPNYERSQSKIRSRT